jgi:hypothetical protein
MHASRSATSPFARAASASSDDTTPSCVYVVW